MKAPFVLPEGAFCLPSLFTVFSFLATIPQSLAYSLLTKLERNNLMSTLSYAAITTRRLKSPRYKSRGSSAPGVGTYVDAMAALVPAEVLTLHGLLLTVTTQTRGETTTITDVQTLKWSFVALIVLSLVLYVWPRLLSKTWEKLDIIRAAIPALAFIAWTMLQRATAFDAVRPLTMRDSVRSAIAFFLAVLLGLLAASLAAKADATDPTP